MGVLKTTWCLSHRFGPASSHGCGASANWPFSPRMQVSEADPDQVCVSAEVVT